MKFGPLGWNVSYNFGDADMDAALKLLGRFVDDLGLDPSARSLTTLPVDSLVYVTGNITYGGWVTDEWDRRCLLAVLDHFYNASVFGDKVRQLLLSNILGANQFVVNHYEFVALWHGILSMLFVLRGLACPTSDSRT